MRIGIIGGGPAGLYLARLLKLHTPQHDVEVFEQNAPDATFGFGVGLGGTARDIIRSMDPEVHDRITKAMVFSNTQRIQINGTDVVLEYGQTGGAIGRLGLLQILQACCAEIGVKVTHNYRIDGPEALSGFDLVVGADGINSVVRRIHGDAFGTETKYLTNHFAWFGVGRAMKRGSLVFRTVNGGRFVGHYYPYTQHMSTFVPECDAQTWVSSGMAEMTDNERRAFIEKVFAEELQGDSLIDNRSMWRNFPVITNRNWYVGNAVIIGDALFSAHFSIGSGTRLAMDDAMALFQAIQQTDSVPAAQSRFVEIRKPIRERFLLAAEKSFTWYERLEEVMKQAPLDFVYDFLTRTGRIDDERMAKYAPKFFERYTASKRTTEKLAV